MFTNFSHIHLTVIISPSFRSTGSKAMQWAKIHQQTPIVPGQTQKLLMSEGDDGLG